MRYRLGRALDRLRRWLIVFCRFQVFIMYCNWISAVPAPRTVESFDAEGAWTVEGLEEAMGPYFEKRQPISDGFAMAPQ